MGNPNLKKSPSDIAEERGPVSPEADAVKEIRGRIPNIGQATAGAPENKQMTLKDLQYNTEGMWDSFNFEMAELSPERFEEAVKQYLVNNKILRAEDVEDGVITFKADVQHDKVGNEEYEADYQGSATVEVYNEYGIYEEGLDNTRNENGLLKNMTFNFKYRYKGDRDDIKPKYESGDATFGYEW